ncbi:hypothetical protein DFH11DRAFT_1735764 [Phellopilus nigrolimitatus]|nr:hypothetical protein DFH11DRAFT_1735764 [Phellopilus nigrolimitatus]
MVRPPQPVFYCFFVDMIYAAVSTGIVATACRSLLETLDRIPNDDNRTKIAIIAFDVTLYCFTMPPGTDRRFGGDISSSGGRFYDDPHNDAWAAQAPAFGHWSPRSARWQREHYASRGDGYSDYSYEHDAPPSLLQSGYSEYYSASSEPCDEPAFYEAGYHDRPGVLASTPPHTYALTPARAPPVIPVSRLHPGRVSPLQPFPSAPRKLVILDLNGTLLVRTARGVPHPRPYMPALRDFRFTPRTRAWVRCCFFDALFGVPLAGTAACDADEGFVAVWARDTLGLSHGD